MFKIDDVAYGEARDEVEQLVADVLGARPPEVGIDVSMWPCLATTLSFIDKPGGEQDGFPWNFLSVSVNRGTRFGALVWFVTDRSGKSGGVYDRTWVSDNTNPPVVDPRVTVGYTGERLHSPRSCLPLEEIGGAVREFCFSGTGDRPESIAWIEGNVNGWRLDDPPPEFESLADFNPWA
jgi:hypothetical protein